jgi:hypothetical protein
VPKRNSGHPGNEAGWVVGAGLRLNVPYFAQGDFFQTQVTYTEGALRYIFQTPNSNWDKVEGVKQGFGVLSDAVYGSDGCNGVGVCTNATSLHLTTGWGINAAFEHYWTPALHTSVYGGYAEVKYDSISNAMLCANEHSADGGFGSAAVATHGCDNNWNTWWVGSRQQWDVTKTFYMGVDVLYQKLDTACTHCDGTLFGNGGTITTPISAGKALFSDNVDNWAIRFRVHKDFLP